MEISREMAIQEIESVRKVLGAWVRELRKPSVMDKKGNVKECYPEGVPKGLSVSSLQGIPVNQLRAELTACAGKLEAICSTTAL